MDFKIGDIARLNSGGPHMLVKSVSEHMVTCIWSYSGQISDLPEIEIDIRLGNNNRIYKFMSTSFSKTVVQNITPYLKKKFLQLTAKVLLAGIDHDSIHYLNDEIFLKICNELNITENLAIESMVECNWFIRADTYWIVASNLFHNYQNETPINEPKDFFNL